MTAPPLSKYLAPIVITSTNNAIRIIADATASVVTLTAGTYYIQNDGSADDFCNLLSTLFSATESGAHEWVCTQDATTHKLGFKCVEHAWSITWGHASTTFDETWLGVTAGATTSGNADTYAYATNESARCWFATYAVADDPDIQTETDAAQSRAKSGSLYTTTLGEDCAVRDVVHAYEPIQKVLPTSGYTNQDWKAFRTNARNGETILFYPNVGEANAYAAYTNTDGFFTCVLDEGTLKEFKPDRMFKGVDAYQFRVRMLVQP